MKAQPTLRIMVSYSRDDQGFVDKLAASLESLGFKPWVDRQRLRPGKDWQDQVQEAIEQCDVVLVVLSPCAVGSENVKREYRYALGQGKYVIPVLHKECRVPIDLYNLQHADFKGDYGTSLYSLVASLKSGTAMSLPSQAETGTVFDEAVVRFRAWFGGPFGSVRDLTWRELSAFTQALFSAVGYTVEGLYTKEDGGLHFRLVNSGAVRGENLALVSVAQKPNGSLVGSADVRAFAQLLAGAFGYMVTAGEFTPTTHAVASALPNVRLIDGKHLQRYLSFVRIVRQTDKQLLPSPDYLLAADSIPRVRATDTKILALVQNKGGVGKTTCAVSLAAALAARGKRTLLMDFDAQGNLRSLSHPAVVWGRQFSLSDYLAGRCALADAICPTLSENVWLLPAGSDLMQFESTQISPEAELAFAAELHASVTESQRTDMNAFDWIIIDAPPMMGRTTRTALVSGHYIVMPTRVESFALRGTKVVMDYVDSIRALMGRGVRVLGGLVNFWEDNQYQGFEAMKAQYLQQGWPLLSTHIPVDGALGHVTSMVDVINLIQQKQAHVAHAFGALVDELEALTEDDYA